MKISEYQKKFEDLFALLEAEHGDVSKVVIESSIKYSIWPAGVKETIARCSIQFGEMD